MNRSILIVICDFLLVSLLTFSTLDFTKLGEEGGAPSGATASAPAATADPAAVASQDLGKAMKTALDQERKDRQKLLDELTQARATLGQKQALLSEQQALVADREKRLQATETLIRTREQQIKDQERQIKEREQQVQIFQQQVQASDDRTRKLQQEQAGLASQYQATINNLQALNNELKSNAVQNVLSQENVAATEAAAREQTARAASLQAQLAQLALSNQLAQAEQQRLNSQLLSAEAEKRSAAETAARLQQQVEAERREKTKLTEGLASLAAKNGDLAEKNGALAQKTGDLAQKANELIQKTGNLAQQIDAGRLLAPNAIFSAFATNRVDAHFEAFRSGLFGLDSNKRQDLKIVLVSDNTNTFALCHVRDTPVTLADPGTDWQSLSVMLSRDLASCNMSSLSFLVSDPRVVLIPVSKSQAQALGGHIYRLEANPQNFQDAVVVGTRDNYYGECKFQIDLSIPNYLTMDRNSLKGLFGKFNPSTGDLVFSRTGDLLGVMANDRFCVLPNRLQTAGTIQLGDDLRAQHTGQALELMHSMVSQLPSALR